jgi:hypothetical protein
VSTVYQRGSMLGPPDDVTVHRVLYTQGDADFPDSLTRREQSRARAQGPLSPAEATVRERLPRAVG